MAGLKQNSTERLIQKMTEQNNYGSVQYYTDMFADIMADVQYDSPDYGDNIIAGFKAALKDWREYYEEQVKEHQRIEQKANDEIWLHWWTMWNHTIVCWKAYSQTDTNTNC